MGKMMSPLLAAVLNLILFILAGNGNIQESLEEFEIRLDPNTGFHGKNLHRLIMGKMMSPLLAAVLNLILFILAGNGNIQESLEEFEIRLDPNTGFHGNR